LDHYEFHSPSLWTCLKIFSPHVWNQLNVPWATIETRYHSTLNNLGPYAASLFLHSELRQHISRIDLEYSESMQLMNYDTNIGVSYGVKRKLPPEEFWTIRDVHAGFNDYFPDLSMPTHTSAPVPLLWCTPKVQSLVQILLAYHTSTFQGIIFVEQRQVAACLSSILPALPLLNGIIRTACLVGQGVGVDGLTKSNPGARVDAVSLFRTGKINLC
jgi:endoribonuclease Dicer